MTARFGRGLALGGLTALLLTLLTAGPPTSLRLLAAAPLVVTLAAGVRPPPGWNVAVALLMLPYFSFGVMEAIANSGHRARAALIALLSIGICLASLDSRRRR